MANRSKIYCFRASYEFSTNFDASKIPDWLSLDVNWQGYRITTVPWIADVARLLDILAIEDAPEDWIAYLESLGFKEITRVCYEEFFEDKLYF